METSNQRSPVGGLIEHLDKRLRERMRKKRRGEEWVTAVAWTYISGDIKNMMKDHLEQFSQVIQVLKARKKGREGLKETRKWTIGKRQVKMIHFPERETLLINVNNISQ